MEAIRKIEVENFPAFIVVSRLRHNIASCNILYYPAAMVTVTVKLPPTLNARLTAEARKKRISKSALIRESLNDRFANGKTRRRITVGELAGHLMGKAKGGPHDLSTNKKHMEGFGE